MAGSCASCVFYMASPKACRRYPPTPLMVGVKQGIASLSQQEPLIASYFPTILPTGWCGEYIAAEADWTAGCNETEN